MTTAKARFQGGGTGTPLKDFSDELKDKLRGLCPETAQSDFENPADAFANHILAETWWAKDELHRLKKFDCTKAELRAECDKLLELLCEARDKLRSLSPDFDRLLGIEADPLGCADKIDALIGPVESAGCLIDAQPQEPKTADKQYDVAVELAVRVLRVLVSYGIAPAATAGIQQRMVDITQAVSVEQHEAHYQSKAVEILKAIGADMGLVRAETTWRDIICTAKQAASDLK